MRMNSLSSSGSSSLPLLPLPPPPPPPTFLPPLSWRWLPAVMVGAECTEGTVMAEALDLPRGMDLPPWLWLCWPSPRLRDECTVGSDAVV